MKWSFEGPNGAVTVRQEGEKAICQAIRAAEGDGLYKAWLRGGQGRVLLGTLIPEGGALRLRRTISLMQLKRQGAWPPVGAEIVLTFPFQASRENAECVENAENPPEPPPVPPEPTPPPAPEGFQWIDRLEQYMRDPLLRRVTKDLEHVLLQSDPDGFQIALPFCVQEPFPIPPLFCLSQTQKLEGEWYVLFRFSRDGQPELFPEPSEEGKKETGGNEAESSGKQAF